MTEVMGLLDTLQSEYKEKYEKEKKEAAYHKAVNDADLKEVNAKIAKQAKKGRTSGSTVDSDDSGIILTSSA
jgi:hypothetical protein